MLSSTEVTYMIFGLSLLAMIWYITNRGRANLAKAKEDAAAALATAISDAEAAANSNRFESATLDSSKFQ